MNIKKLKGFTLAEVLITLAIIGVVAAITIPPLIQKGGDVATISSVKKAYSTLQNALKSAYAEEGYVCNWYEGTDEQSVQLATINSILSKYLKITKNCGTEAGCLPSEYFYLDQGERPPINFDSDVNYSKMKLADGTLLWVTTKNVELTDDNEDYDVVYTADHGGLMFYVDTNGEKAPNRLGYDTFVFSVVSVPFDNKYSKMAHNQTLMPGNYTEIAPPGDCNFVGIPSPKEGLSCARWVIQKETMLYKYKEVSWDDW